MADPYTDIPELSAQQAGIARRRKIAEAMQAQAMQPLQSQQIPNGYVVPTSPLLGIGKVLEAYLASKGMKEADTAETGLADKYKTMEAEAVKNYKTKFNDQVNPYPVNDQMSPEAQQFAQADGQQIVPGDKRGAIIDALTSPFKGLNVAGTLDMKAMETEANDKRDAANKMEQAKIAAQSREDIAKYTAQARADALAETARHNKETEAIQKQLADVKSGATSKATKKDQESALNALKSAGYDPLTGKDAISDLINKSTSGWLQKQGANIAAIFDITTPGREALNTLGAASSAIVMQMMGGKLGSGISNADRDFVMAQLGDVANPDKTSGERLAAWNFAKARMIGVGMLPDSMDIKQEKKKSAEDALSTWQKAKEPLTVSDEDLLSKYK